MSKRAPAVDVLKETRRAMRILRRVERHLVQTWRDEKRLAEKTRARFEAERERVQGRRS